MNDLIIPLAHRSARRSSPARILRGACIFLAMVVLVLLARADSVRSNVETEQATTIKKTIKYNAPQERERKRVLEEHVKKLLKGSRVELPDATGVALLGLEALNNKYSDNGQRMRNVAQRAVPLMEYAVRLPLGKDDWVTLENLGGAVHMIARKLYASGGNDTKWLINTARYFEQAEQAKKRRYAKREHESIEEYPQLRYQKPNALVVRSWGDTLTWLDLLRKAALVYGKGEEAGIWRTAWCRPEKRFSLRPFARSIDFENKYIFPASSFPHVHAVVSSFLPDARQEIEEAYSHALIGKEKGSNVWSMEQSGLHQSASWIFLPLMIDGRLQSNGCTLMPKTCSALSSMPSVRWLRKGQVKINVMAPGTKVRPHCGPTAGRLRMMCTLVLPDSPDSQVGWIRVGDPSKEEKRYFRAYPDCFVFRESCQHEVEISKSAAFARIVLIVDFANPFLSKEEYALQLAPNESEAPASSDMSQALEDYEAFPLLWHGAKKRDAGTSKTYHRGDDDHPSRTSDEL